MTQMKPILAAATVMVVGICLAPAAHAANFETQSGLVLCAVTPAPSIPVPDAVICQGRFVQTGMRGAAAVTTGDGTFNWDFNGNLAVNDPKTKMSYGQTYNWGNWTIYPDRNGTRFTNTRTGHGMFVSVENVYAF